MVLFCCYFVKLFGEWWGKLLLLFSENVKKAKDWITIVGHRLSSYILRYFFVVILLTFLGTGAGLRDSGFFFWSFFVSLDFSPRKILGLWEKSWKTKKLQKKVPKKFQKTERFWVFFSEFFLEPFSFFLDFFAKKGSVSQRFFCKKSYSLKIVKNVILWKC